MKKSVKTLIAVCVTVPVLCLALVFCNALLIPKYSRTHIPEGALIAEYYGETTSHDILFLGDCEVYESFIPEVLWNEYGLTAYVRGSAQQLVFQSYYLLEEMLKTEEVTPRAVVFNVYALCYGEGQSESYNRMTLDGMQWSSSKAEAVRASMTEGESFLSYLFPLLRYHSRWKEVTLSDFTGMFDSETVSHSGYLLQKGVVPKTSDAVGKPLEDTELPATAMEYLGRMADLCAERGTELILIKSPTNNWRYWWYDEWDAQVASFAEERGLAYLNLIPKSEEIGIDWSEDTYDGGLHLNVRGAEKLTSYFGRYLSDRVGVPAHDEATSSVWNEKYRAYVADRDGTDPDGETDTETDTNAERDTSSGDVSLGTGFAFPVGGCEVKIGMTLTETVRLALGTPTARDVSPSCAGADSDVRYTYASYIVETSETAGTETVTSIRLLDDAYATDKGVTVGSDRDAVTGAYGTPTRETDGVLIYENQNMKLQFHLRDGEVTAILYTVI